MEKLGLNERMEIVLNLKPADLVKYCSVNKKTNKEICESDIFWRRKLEKDYPKEMLKVKTVVKNPKNVYMKRFTSVAYKIEKFIEVFINYNFGKDFNEYLSEEYKKELFNSVYTGYEKIKNYDFSKNSNPEKDIKLDIMIDEIAMFYPDPEYTITFDQTEEFNYTIMLKLIDEMMKETLSEILYE